MSKMIISFSAPWCKACKSLEPALEKAAEKVKVVHINVEENPEAAHSFQVMNLPTLILVENGNEVDRITGSSETNIFNVQKFAGLV